MTAQIGDIYKYQKKKFTIVASTSTMPFNPRNFGLEPHTSSTACWRGYWCEYSIENDELLLKNLYLFNSEGKYPTFNGVDISPQEFEEYEYFTLTDEAIKKGVRPAHHGHRVYKDANLPIPYTGKILLGNGFMRGYYVHMGFQRGWAYKTLIELVFEEGRLTEYNDFSHIAKEQRKAMKEANIDPHRPDGGNIPKFVRDSFSLDYTDKAWWIE